MAMGKYQMVVLVALTSTPFLFSQKKRRVLHNARAERVWKKCLEPAKEREEADRKERLAFQAE